MGWTQLKKLPSIEETWERTGRFITEAVSVGDKATINVIKPWRVVLDLLRQLKAKQDARTAVGMPQVPSTETRSEDGVPGEVAGGMDTHWACKRRGQVRQPRCAKMPSQTSLPCS